MNFLFSPFGRFKRWQYWTVHLLSFILAVLIFMLGMFLFVMFFRISNTPPPTDPNFLYNSPYITGLWMVLAVFMFWLSFCATVKRFHDHGKSGLWFLLNFIPVVGPLWVLIECGFLVGEDDDNEYGPADTFGGGGIEEEIRLLKASHGYGTSQTAAPRSSSERKDPFPPPPKPLFGQGSGP